MQITSLPAGLQTWVDTGTLVPILGEECLRVGLDTFTGSLPHPLQSIVDRMARCVAELEGEEREQDFIFMLAEHVPLAINRQVLTPQDGRERPPYEDKVITLCRELTRASVKASQLFAEGLLTDGAVFSYADHGIDVSRSPDLLEEFRTKIDQATAAARELKGRAVHAEQERSRSEVVGKGRDWNHPDRALFELLGATELCERLDALRVSLDGAQLPGSMVEFLTAILWHCFRFDSDVPPTSGELALMISLTARHQLPASKTWRRPTRAHINWIRHQAREEVARHVTGALRSTDASPERTATKARTKFYREIARYLLGAPSQPRGRSRKPQRLAFVTTFDLELERALLDALNDYEQFHVVIPVVLEQRRVNPENREQTILQPTWLMGTFDSDAANPIATEWCWGVDWKSQGGLAPPIDLIGPVVVKLCGSPFHEAIDPRHGDRRVPLDKSPVEDHPSLWGAVKTCDPASALGMLGVEEGDMLYHDIALAEFAHLERAPLLSDLLPFWIRQAVGRQEGRQKFWQRQIMFVGVPVNDWIDRLWVFFQKKGFDPPAGYFDKHDFLALSREFDPMAAEVLDTLMIERCSQPLESLTAFLHGTKASRERQALGP